jgi:hypothetical protein
MTAFECLIAFFASVGVLFVMGLFGLLFFALFTYKGKKGE